MKPQASSATTEDIAQAEARVLEHFQRCHRVTSLDEVEATEVRGYWRRREPCGDGCREPIHAYLGCAGPMHHTMSYLDPPRDEHGRWSSPYRTWQQLVKHRKVRQLEA